LTSGQTTAAFITPAPLTAAVTAPNKVYDGDTTASPTLVITAGLVGTEQVSATGTASFNAKNVVTANVVSVGSVTLSDGANGGLASNYSLTSGQTTTAFITPAPLTITDIAASSAVSGNDKPGVAVLTGRIGADKVTATVVVDNPAYSAPGFLKAGDYKQAVHSLSGEDASNYAVTSFTTTLANYTVMPLPVKSAADKPAVAVAVLSSLPTKGVATDRPTETTNNRAAVKTQDTTKTLPTSSAQQDAKATSNTAQAAPVNAAKSEVAAAPPKLGTDKQVVPPSQPALLQTAMKQVPLPKPNPTQANLMTTVAPALVMGFAEQGMDVDIPLPPMQAGSDMLAISPTTLEPVNNATDNAAVEWEDRFYATAREVMESPVTYQVLTGASSVAILVKALAPSLLPTFSLGGGLPLPTPTPTPAPAPMPTQPGSMGSGRTLLGRFFGGA
jgi:hypothetical protein